jgi:hypothetical protein
MVGPFRQEQAPMAEENLAILQRAREHLVKQRLAIAKTLAEGYKRGDTEGYKRGDTERQMVAMVDVQHVIEVIDKAIADERPR